MGLFSGLFGPSREAVWRELAASLHGEYLAGGFFQTDRVQVRSDPWIITLDLESRSTGKTTITYTRLRAPFVNWQRQNLRVYRAGLFSGLGKWLGIQDIELGSPGFDQNFILQGASPEWVRALLDARATELIDGHERFYLEIRSVDHWFGPKYPDGVDLLAFELPEVIKDAGRLRSLFQLFEHLLRRTEELALGSLDEGARRMAVLRGPGGTIREGEVLLWDGDLSRRQATEALGRMREIRAVPDLINAIRPPYEALRPEAVTALGQIGAPEAVPALIPLLGMEVPMRDAGLSGRVAQALVALGADTIVNAFRESIAGRREALAALGPHRAEFIAAFTTALASDHLPAVGEAATALAHLGAVAALEPLRRRHRQLDARHTEARDALARAIEQLSDLSRLPRPASSPGVDATALPRPADQGASPDLDSLPRPS